MNKQLVFIFLFSLLGGCQRSSTDVRPEITEAEVDQLLTRAAQTAAMELPRSFCINSQIEQKSSIQWAGSSDLDGWIASPMVPGSKYRQARSSNPMQLPAEALRAFGEPRVRSGCRHTLVFKRPEFVEISDRSGRQIEITIQIVDYCPLCGAGYSIRFKRVANSWWMEPNKIFTAWVS